MSSIEHMIRALAVEGVQINLWPTETGFQANVKERAGNGWTCCTGDDPLDALRDALRQRQCGIAGRQVVPPPEPEPIQIEIEEAIAAAPPAPAYEDLLG